MNFSLEPLVIGSIYLAPMWSLFNSISICVDCSQQVIGIDGMLGETLFGRIGQFKTHAAQKLIYRMMYVTIIYFEI